MLDPIIVRVADFGSARGIAIDQERAPFALIFLFVKGVVANIDLEVLQTLMNPFIVVMLVALLQAGNNHDCMLKVATLQVQRYCCFVSRRCQTCSCNVIATLLGASVPIEVFDGLEEPR